MNRHVAFITLSLLLASASVVQAGKVLFVRAGGNDSADGSSPGQALRSISHAAALMHPGDRVVVGPGVYLEGNIQPSQSGDALHPFVFEADSSGIQTGDKPGDVLIDATGTDTGFFLQSKLSYVTIDGFAIRGATNAGIVIKSDSDNVSVADCRLFSNRHGLLVQDVRNVTIFNNLSYANTMHGMLLTGYVTGVSNISLINNTLYGNGQRGLFIGANPDYPASDITAVNNITAANADAGLQVGPAATEVVRGFNLIADRYASGTLPDATDIQGDPMFINPAGADGILGGEGFADDDFHLADMHAGQKATSPAIGAGSGPAAALRLQRASVRSDGRGEPRRVSLGYHYGNHSLSVLGRLGIPNRLSVPYRPLYVSRSGNDANNGTRPGMAVATIGRAAQLARNGNVVFVAPGTYSEGDINVASSGASGRPISFLALRGALLPYWANGPVVIDAAGFSAAFRIANRSNIIIDGFVFTGASAGGVYVKSESTNVVIQNTIAVSNLTNGIYIENSSNVTVSNNLVYDNGGSGIRVSSQPIPAGSPDSTFSVKDFVIRNNTVYGNGNRGIYIRGDDNQLVTNVDVRNNITADNIVAGLQVTANGSTSLQALLSSYTGDYNLVADLYGPRTPTGSHDINADPLFVNPPGPDGILGGAGCADDDFRLSQRRGGQAATSPAVDAAPDSPDALGLGWLTTAETGVPDVGRADLGFHYQP